MDNKGGGKVKDESMRDTLQPYEILAVDAIGNPTFIDFISTKVKSDDKSVYEFLKTVYGFDKNTTFEEKKNSYVLQNGIHSKKLFQFYKGIKVQWGQIVIIYKDGYLRSVNGHFTPTENSRTFPMMPIQNIIDGTLQKIGAEEYAWQNMYLEAMIKEETQNPKATHYPTAELLLIDKNIHKDETDVRLVFKLDIYSLAPESHKEYFVDATTGEIVYKESLIMHVTGDADTRYSGKQKIETQFFNGSYRLHDYTRGNGIITYDLRGNDGYAPTWDFIDNNNLWSSAEHANAARDDAALDAHWGAEMTYDYFLEKHQRNSWDDTGKAIINYVHSSIGNDKIATWRGGSQSAFGRIQYGDNNRGNPWAGIEMTGHEFGHGVEGMTSQIASPNSYEGGALREGLSDIWGAMVRYYAKPQDSFIYVVGGDVYSFRDISNPNRFRHPDTYKDPSYWIFDGDTSQYYPYHKNGNVLGYWFYLLAEGGTGVNSLGNSYTIQGIGKKKAAEIVYRAETVIFTSDVRYYGARLGTIRAAIDLFGRSSEEAKTVCKTWYAVGVGGNECSSRIVDGNGTFESGNSPSDPNNPNDPSNQSGAADVICDRGSKTYALIFVSETSDVVWSVSSNLELVNRTQLTVTVRARTGSQGHAYVFANVDGVVMQKNIWIGSPQATLRLQQTHPYQVALFIEGMAGTDISKQGITSVVWRQVSSTGNCIPDLTANSNSFVGFVQASCNTWATQLHISIVNECGRIEFTRNITSDGYTRGDGYPCYYINDKGEYIELHSCYEGEGNSASGSDEVIQIDVHNYMGIHYGTYKNTNSFSTSNFPFGLYFIKIQNQAGQLFTLKFIKK